MPRTPGTHTDIQLGLKTAHEKMFQTSNGMRPTAPKTLIFITDGRHNMGRSPNYSDWKQTFLEEKIRVVVVGVGSLSQTYKDKLLDLVDSSDDLYFAKDFDELLKEEFIKSITLCEGIASFLTGINSIKIFPKKF